MKSANNYTEYETFTVMCENEEVAIITLSKDHKYCNIERLTMKFPQQPFQNVDNNTIEYVYMFLKTRCYDDNRVNLKEILEAHGMTWNNPWEWCRKTHGVNYDDYWWIRYPGEEDLRWEDVKVRD